MIQQVGKVTLTFIKRTLVYLKHNIPNDINLFGEKAPSILEANQPYYSKTSYKISEK